MGAESTTYFDHADYGMNTGPSAVAIVDLLLQWLSPISVVDAGCGTGMFHKEFKKRGADTILGLDGASTSSVFRPGKSNFQVVDLTEPLELDRGFDLALCLEVAEHLPESSADLLVKTLTDLAPLALFSAAPIPARVDRATSTNAGPSTGSGASLSTDSTEPCALCRVIALYGDPEAI